MSGPYWVASRVAMTFVNVEVDIDINALLSSSERRFTPFHKGGAGRCGRNSGHDQRVGNMARSSRPRRVLFAGAVALALVAAACGGDSAPGDDATASDTDGREGERTPSDTLNLLTPLMAAGWDTRQTTGFINTVQLAVTEPLTVLQVDGSFSPLLASEVEHPDPVTYIYTIRPGSEFSDGTPLTPEDVKFSFELHVGEDTTSVRARFFTGVESVALVGDDQVQVTLAGPDPEFPYAVAALGIVSKAHYEAHPDDVGTPGTPQIGTGPYLFSEFTPGSSVTLEPNPGYRGDPPAFDSLTFDTASDDSSRLLALQSGDFDGVILPPVHQVDAIEELGTYTTYSAPDANVYRVVFDTTKAPFDDIHVRKAIAYAIDREAMATGVFGGHIEIADSVVPESMVAALEGDADVAEVFDELAAEFEFDLDAARTELAQSSVPDGFSIEVPVWSGEPNAALVIQVMAQSLAEIGIDLTAKQVDENGWHSAFLDGQNDGLVVTPWSGGSPEQISLPRTLFLPGNLGNFSKLDDAEVNDSIAAYLAADGDASIQQAALIDTLTAVQAATPYVPIGFLNWYIMLDDDVELTAVTPWFWMVPFTDAFVPT